ncbi:MAG: SHOCT domain-containing protein [bacterium]|nr:SHOCT domain-containing protein [bacterium]
MSVIVPPPVRPWIDEITGKKSTTEKLEELKKLYEKGTLSEEEYKKAKEKVIEQM